MKDSDGMTGKGTTIVEICDITKENEQTTTLRFGYPAHVLPGQFVMVWVPGLDEIPMSLSYLEDIKGITVKCVGETTKMLSGLNVGDKIGIRGPLGNGFTTDLIDKHVLIVGGGTGIAPLAALAENINMKEKITFVAGARTANELFMLDRVERAADVVVIATDDGSAGFHGYASEAAAGIIKKGCDVVLTCGPEPMMQRIIAAANDAKLAVEASLERYMKCGIGICDSCSINGFRVCMEGPVFNGKILAQLTEFGDVRRSPSGRLEKI